MNKKWYLSKTLWVNFLAFIALAIQTITGNEIFKIEYQAYALTAVNFLLRIITKSELS
jgi:hypothetical protein